MNALTQCCLTLRGNLMKRIIPILIITILLLGVIPGASAGIIDDIDNAIGGSLQKLSQSVQRLSLPGVGSITIRCNAGATCGQSGENWIVSMNSMSNAQTIDLELQPGIKSISGNTELTTGSSVIIEITEKAPIQTVPVIQNSNYQYVLRNGFLGTMNTYTATVYERSGISSTITTNYDVKLMTADTTTTPMPMSYDYTKPQTIYLKDNMGNLATISPTHQVSGGIVTDVGSVVFVDDGYGMRKAFDKINLKYYMDKVNSEIQYVNPYYIGNLPQNWAQYIDRMKTLGLQEFTDLPLVQSGNNIIMTYPVGSVGTQLQAIIPKAMAKTITVVQNWGQPRIDSATLSPENIVKGQGLSTLTVKVTNIGTSDTINVNLANTNGATVTAVTNSMRLAQNQQGTYTFLLNPTLSNNGKVAITVNAIAGGSGIKDTKTVYLAVTVPDLITITNQKVIVKAYTPDGAILSNAPIYKNGQQAGQGTYEATLPLGTYSFSTDNSTNPGYFSPTQVEVKLTGGEPKIVSLTFSLTPQGQDLTWIFWGLLILAVGFVLYKQGILLGLLNNPMQIAVIIILIFVVYILYSIYLVLSGFATWF